MVLRAVRGNIGKGIGFGRILALVHTKQNLHRVLIDLQHLPRKSQARYMLIITYRNLKPILRAQHIAAGKHRVRQMNQSLPDKQGVSVVIHRIADRKHAVICRNHIFQRIIRGSVHPGARMPSITSDIFPH